MKKSFLLASVAAFLAASPVPFLAQKTTPQDLVFQKIPTSWDEGLPIGNGRFGGILWQKGTRLRLALDAAEHWDERPMAGILNKKMQWADSSKTFEWVKKKVVEGDYAPVQKWGDEPYEREAGPTKLPVGALEIDVAGLGEVEEARLFLAHGLIEVRWKNGARFRAAVAEKIGFWFEMIGGPQPEFVGADFSSGNQKTGNSVAGQGLGRLGYPPLDTLFLGEKGAVFSQNGWKKYFSIIFLKQSASEGFLILMPKKETEKLLHNCTGWDGFFESISFFKTSEVSFDSLKIENFTDRLDQISLPEDPILERQWFRNQYLFCSAGDQPITLQAVWTADNGSLPPWKGDFHHDLNTEMSYWAAFSGDQIERAARFSDWLWSRRVNFEPYTKAFFECDGLNAPGVTTRDGQAMGGWIQYSMSPTVSAWLAQHFFWQARLGGDSVFLERKALVWFEETARFLECLFEKGAENVVGEDARNPQTAAKNVVGEDANNGQPLVLPLSSSPEIGDNRREAWFVEEWTNYDLALARFVFEKGSELSKAAKKDAQAAHYQQVASRLPPFSKNADGSLRIAPSLDVATSHRHFSHLMAIFPLGLIDLENGKSDSATIAASLLALEKFGSGDWTGYSFAWLATLHARARDGERAADALRKFAECFVLPNGFHCNGDQCGGRFSKMTYRPVTLEGNFAFNAAVQEMMMQSHAGAIRVFPAAPKTWKNAAFKKLRASGAFLVSAKMRDGKCAEIEVFAEKTGLLRLVEPFANRVIEREMRAGETFFWRL